MQDNGSTLKEKLLLQRDIQKYHKRTGKDTKDGIHTARLRQTLVQVMLVNDM